jgi:two-component system phosphate regulon sensor histidine kinase PhoR
MGQLGPNQVHHLHKGRADNYFFASFVLKEDQEGEKFIVCFQMNLEKTLAMLDRYLRDLQPRFYASIVDFDNNGVYSQPISRSSKYFYETRFPTTLYKWLLQVVPRNYNEIEQDARQQRRVYLFLIILSMSLIFCSLAIIYVASLRERQLAQLQDDFISHVSHEMKTPLSLISMFSEILLSGRQKNDASKQEYYNVIHTESERMTHLVNNLLDFERLEHEKRPLHLEPVNIAELVDKELEGYRHQVQRDGFRITREVEDPIPDTMADPNAIRTAFFNLLDNSVKYSGGSKELTVKVSRGDGFVDISVADRGPGIPVEEQQKIFEKFYRGSNPAAARVRGSGIGLSITKRIAEMHGGEVTVESQPGEGSVFKLRIPIRTAADVADHK